MCGRFALYTVNNMLASSYVAHRAFGAVKVPPMYTMGESLQASGTTSKAVVVRADLSRNGTVPCHIYKGNNTAGPAQANSAPDGIPKRDIRCVNGAWPRSHSAHPV